MNSTPINSFTQDPQLLAVNNILGCIGQAPVTALDYENPEVFLVTQLLTQARQDTLAEGWNLNTENNLELTLEPTTNRVYSPNTALRLDASGEDVDRTTDIVVREGALYDLVTHDFVNKNTKVDVVWDLQYKDLPGIFQRYITARASTRAAVELVNNSDLYKMLGQNEVALRAALIDYECQSGDYTFFGSPEGTVYRPYSPYRALAR